MRGLKKIEGKITKAREVDEAAVKAELRMLEREEAELDKELARLEQEEKAYEAELEKLRTQKTALEADEKGFWKDVNNYEKNLVVFQDSLASANSQIDSLRSQYTRL
jgi:chromosome segregation ATPase